MMQFIIKKKFVKRETAIVFMVNLGPSFLICFYISWRDLKICNANVSLRRIRVYYGESSSICLFFRAQIGAEKCDILFAFLYVGTKGRRH